MFAAAAGITDHGELGGLGDDDHQQYLLIDGTRAMTGALDMGASAITNVGNVDGRDVSADGATLDGHVADGTIHFTVGSIDHGAIAGLGDDDHTQYLLVNGSRAMTGALDMGTFAITNVGNVDGRDVSADGATLDGHVADGTIHFTEASIDHTAIANIGTNTHAQIDTHVADGTIHFSDAPNDGQSYVRNSLAWNVLPPSVDGLGAWRYRTETAAPPSSGQIRFNNADVSLATEFYLHETNDDGADVSAFLDLLTTAGSVLYIQDKTDSSKYALLELGTSVDSGTYRTYQIASVLEGSGGEPAQNTLVGLAASSGAGVGGVTDHTALTSIGTNTHAQIDTHVADGTVHFTEASIDHTAIANIGTNTHAQIDTHVADGTIHFTEASIDHTAITNIGTNTHAQIDTHVADGTIHFTEASIDHGSVAGLGDDDHAQYLLIDGTRAMTGALQVADVGSPEDGGIVSGNYPVQIKSGVTDAASAVGVQFDTVDDLVTTGATPYSFKTGGRGMLELKFLAGAGPFGNDVVAFDSSSLDTGSEIFGQLRFISPGTLGTIGFQAPGTVNTIGINPGASSVYTSVSGTSGSPAVLNFAANSGGAGMFVMGLENGNPANTFFSAVSTGYSLGRNTGNQANAKWANGYFADDGVLYFGNNADAGISWDATDMSIDPDVNATGGLLRMNNSGSWATTSGGPVPALHANLPTGATATTRKWLTLKDDSGAVYYLPAWSQA